MSEEVEFQIKSNFVLRIDLRQQSYMLPTLSKGNINNNCNIYLGINSITQIDQIITVVCFLQTNQSLIIAWVLLLSNLSIVKLLLSIVTTSVKCEPNTARIQYCKAHCEGERIYKIGGFAQTRTKLLCFDMHYFLDEHHNIHLIYHVTKPNITIACDILITHILFTIVLEPNQVASVWAWRFSPCLCVSTMTCDRIY